MGASIGLAANGDTPAAYNTTKKSCASGQDVTTANYATGTDLTFVPKSRGSSSELKNTTCNAGTGTCELAAAAAAAAAAAGG